jgi:hypothetical protein
MCTVTWRRGRSGYDLWFNRDELHSRTPELPPEITGHEGLRYIAPRDGKHGGTWLLVNETGLTVCLLNDYGAAWRPASGSPRFSRGHIVSACASAASHRDVMEVLQRQPLAMTPAFQLLALSVTEGPLHLHWQGATLVRRAAAQTAPPLSSSSFATEEVVAARLARFCRHVVRPETAPAADYLNYHIQHDPIAGAHSVLMHRPDAATRSIIHVAVDGRKVSLGYQSVSWIRHGPVLSPARLSELIRRSWSAAAA